MSKKYENSKIYKIINEKDNTIFIGSTTQKYLSKRLQKHINDYKIGKTNLLLYSKIKEVGFENLSIELLENYKCKDINELNVKKNYWIKKLKPILNKKNKNIKNKNIKKDKENKKDKNIKKDKEIKKDNIEWDYKNRVPKGFFKNINNQKKYMNWLSKQLGYTKIEDWYKITTKDFKNNNGSYLTTKYKGFKNLIKSIFNNYNWLDWKFNVTVVGFWKNLDNQKIFMNWLGIELGYTKIEDWYKISYKEIINNYGSRLLGKFYNNSPIKLIKTIYSNEKWLEWKFLQVPQGFWKNLDNQKKYMKWLSKQLGYTKIEDWYKIKRKDFINNYGYGLLSHHYNTSPIRLIKTIFNNYEWLEWKFFQAPPRFWNLDNQKKYIKWLGNELGYTKMDDWYKTDIQDFRNNYGSGLLVSKRYNGSVPDLLKNIYPEYKWIIKKFKNIGFSKVSLEWLKYKKIIENTHIISMDNSSKEYTIKYIKNNKKTKVDGF